MISVLVGIDDDLSWRGSSHGSMWGENVQDWNPEEDRARDSVGGMNMSQVELLHQNLAAIQDDGHDLMRILVDRAHELKMGIFASFRMNDAHVSYEDRGWYGRSEMKLKRTDLLIGSAVERFSAGRADEWNFSGSSGKWGGGTWFGAFRIPNLVPRSLVNIVGCSSRGRGNCGKLRATSNWASKPVIRSFPSAVRTVEKQLRALASSPPELLVFPRFA